MDDYGIPELEEKVIEKSKSDNFKDAAREWSVTSSREDWLYDTLCVCGAERVRYLFTLHNKITGAFLDPVSIRCAKHFGVKEISQTVDIWVKMYKLYHAGNKPGAHIEITSKYFSRRMLQALYQQGAFKASKYNHRDPSEDYEFLLSLFNKRNKDQITEREEKRKNALIAYSIKPFLREHLNFVRKPGMDT